MRTHIYIVLAAVMALPLLTRAEEVVVSNTIEAVIDSIVVDEDSIPEWYVILGLPAGLFAVADSDTTGYADLSVVEWFAPTRTEAASCLQDSLLTYDIDGELVGLTTTEYNSNNKTIRTTVWTVADGVYTGVSMTETAYDNNNKSVYSASYTWNSATNDWQGSSRTETVYNELRQIESKITYTWTNNTWLPSQAVTYEYDADGREIANTTYTRNASTNRLVPSKQRLRTYEDGSIVCEINYNTYSNGTWTKGNRKDYTFDAEGRQIAYYYLTGLSNGEFVPASSSSYELKGYDADGNNTTYEKRTWSSNNWKGSTRWDRTYEDGEEVLYITYKWTNNAWVYNSKYVNLYDDNGNQTEEAVYSWTNNTYWKGTSRTTALYDAAGHVLDDIEWAWSLADTAWIGSERTQRTYSGSRLTETLVSTWVNSDWQYVSKNENHYTQSGQKDTTASYTWNTTRNAWDGIARTYYINNNGGTITVNDSWNIDHWQMSSMSRSESLYDTNNRLASTATYTCGADTVWKGSNKTEYDYTATGKNLQTRYYGSFANGNWVQSYRIEYGYDDADRKTLEQKWTLSGTNWTGNYRYEYAYNAAGVKYIDATYNSWNAALGIWIGRTKTEKIYDNTGCQTGLITYVWSTAVNNWIGSYRYSYAYDSSNREISQIVETYDAAASDWVYNTWYEKEYLKNTQVTANQYTWRNNGWCYVSRSEKYYDANNTTLRRVITGAWTTDGNLTSFTDVRYSYTCDDDSPASGQPRTPTDIEEIDENNGTYENNLQPFDPTQPTYNLSGQRVDPAGYHGVVIQGGKTYLLP